MAVIRVSEFTVKSEAFTLPKLTLVVPVKLLPAIMTPVPTAPLLGEKLLITGKTRNGALLNRVAPGVVTSIFPLVAPAGMIAVIRDGEATVNAAGIPLKVTLVAPVRSVPRMLMVVPVGAAAGSVLTKGASPTERLNIEPPWAFGALSLVIP